jgi:ABC-type hemin transport system substrate-binding protein
VDDASTGRLHGAGTAALGNRASTSSLRAELAAVMSMTARVPRIVSLLPSATEIVCALGLVDSLVSVTHEGAYPSGVESKPRLTASRSSRQAMNNAEIDHAVHS